MAVEIIKTDWHTHAAELAQIRTQVFMEEQQVSAADEWDGLDASATHFLVQQDKNAIGCARLLVETQAGKRLLHIGRVAILKPWRGQGIGHQLMQHIIQHCQQRYPGTYIYLHAQCERKNFYQVLGFKADSEEFMDAGIPHIAMHYSPET